MILSIASERGKYIVNKCIEKGYKINTLKLEKLLILIYGTILSKHQKHFFQEDILALKNGLMIKEVDVEFRQYGIKFEKELPVHCHILNYEKEIIDEIIETYGMLEVNELDEIKGINILWELCYEEGKDNIIPDELIEKVFDYYKFYDIDKVNEKEASFLKKLRLQFNNKNNNYK